MLFTCSGRTGLNEAHSAVASRPPSPPLGTVCQTAFTGRQPHAAACRPEPWRQWRLRRHENNEGSPGARRGQGDRHGGCRWGGSFPLRPRRPGETACAETAPRDRLPALIVTVVAPGAVPERAEVGGTAPVSQAGTVGPGAGSPAPRPPPRAGGPPPSEPVFSAGPWAAPGALAPRLSSWDWSRQAVVGDSTVSETRRHPGSV